MSFSLQEILKVLVKGVFIGFGFYIVFFIDSNPLNTIARVVALLLFTAFINNLK